MIRQNFLLAIRNFYKYKGSFFINLIGLSTGITCTLLIYLWVTDELSFDKFHEKDAQLYQVMQNIPLPADTLTEDATPAILASALKDEFPEVEAAANVIVPDWFDNDKGIVSFGEKHLQARGQFAQSDYLSMFSWKLLHGSPKQVLADRNNVIISDEMAINLFGDVDKAVGETLEWNQEETEGIYQVSGIFEKNPSNSTAQFDLLFNYEVIFERKKENFNSWGNSNPHTYIILAKHTDLSQFNRKIKSFIRNKYLAAEGSKWLDNIGTLFARPYSDRYLYNTYSNGQQSGGRISYVNLFSVIAIFLLGIACINFMNLSTARASRRLKEIGIKKAVGADRITLIFQFLSESFLVTFLSLIVALVMVMLLLPQFNILTGKELSLDLTPHLFWSVLIIGGTVSLLSGSYPALYLSRFKPIVVLKGGHVNRQSTSFISELVTRKGLVVFQFTISIILIVSVVVIYKQIDLIQTKNLGYNDENIISFKSSGRLLNQTETFIKEVKKISGVTEATSFGHDLVGNHGATTGVEWPNKQVGGEIEFNNLEVGYNWLELLEIELAEGRTFSEDYTTDNRNIIFNEAAITAMGLENPVGQVIKLWGQERRIIGVVKNFNFESLYEKVQPCFIKLDPNLTNILIKIEGEKTSGTLAQIESFYKEFNEGLPFDYKFMDDDYQKLYASEQRVATLSNYFAGIALVISCLGLFALAAFTTERRQKEIGIRKVLGSSAVNIVQILSVDFTKMVLIAILIGLPISYFMAEEWLASFAFRINLSWWWFVLSGISALAIAWLTVGIQTLKAANLNPVECLKHE